MQRLQYDLRSPAAKKDSISHAAEAENNLDATTTMRSAKTELRTEIPFTLRERSCSYKAKWKSIGNSSTNKTCNPIYIAGTILQLQITLEFHRQLIHQHHLLAIPFTLHLQCATDPNIIGPQTRQVDHRGSGTDFVWKDTGLVSLLSFKMPFVRDLLQKSNLKMSFNMNSFLSLSLFLITLSLVKVFPSRTLPLTMSFPGYLKIKINSFP